MTSSHVSTTAISVGLTGLVPAWAGANGGLQSAINWVLNSDLMFGLAVMAILLPGFVALVLGIRFLRGR